MARVTITGLTMEQANNLAMMFEDNSLVNIINEKLIVGVQKLDECNVEFNVTGNTNNPCNQVEFNS